MEIRSRLTQHKNEEEILEDKKKNTFLYFPVENHFVSYFLLYIYIHSYTPLFYFLKFLVCFISSII